MPGITEQGEAAGVELVLVLGDVGALDVDGDVVRAHLLGHDAQAERADPDRAADGRVDLAELADGAVDLERQPGFGRDAEPGRRDLLERRMVERDGEVVEDDVVVGVAADLEQVVGDPRGADDLPRQRCS